MSDSTADVLQRYMAAFMEDHYSAARAFYADDILLRIPGNHAHSGEFRGLDEVAETLDAFGRPAGGTVEVSRVKDAAFASGTAMVHVEMTAATTHATACWERVILYRVNHGRISEISFFEFDVRLVESLFRGQYRQGEGPFDDRD